MSESLDFSSTDMTPAERHFAALSRRFPVAGRRVLDIGCGAGAFVRQLTDAGADAIGLEVSEATIERAKEAGIDPDRLVLGDGQSLPFPDESFDGASFVFSFHHVPDDLQERMLAEVARVLRPGGVLVAIEPLPEGPMSKVISPIEDEGEVRTRSQARLAAVPASFVLEGTDHYDIAGKYASYEGMIKDAVAVDAARAERAAAPGVVEAVAAHFAEAARPDGAGGFELSQPCVLFHFRKG